MGTTATAQLRMSIAVKWSKTRDVGNAVAALGLSQADDFANGEDVSEIENVIIKAGTIAPSGSVNIDLNDAVPDPGGDTVAMSVVKAFVVKITTDPALTTEAVKVGGSFNSWLDDASDEVRLHPGGAMMITNPQSGGYPSGSGALTLINEDAVNSQTYEVMIIGEVA